MASEEAERGKSIGRSLREKDLACLKIAKSSLQCFDGRMRMCAGPVSIICIHWCSSTTLDFVEVLLVSTPKIKRVDVNRCMLL